MTVLIGFLAGLIIYLLFFATTIVLVYRMGGPGVFLDRIMPPLLKNIIEGSLFYAPIIQVPTTFFALIGGLCRNQLARNSIAWAFPFLWFLGLLKEIRLGQGYRGAGKVFVTADSPLPLRIWNGIETDLLSLLMSVVWVYFIVYIFVPTIKTHFKRSRN